MNAFPSIPMQFGRRRRRSQVLRGAILVCFSRSAESVSESLASFTAAEWRANLVWLDTSGLALYFLDRVVQLKCEHRLPLTVLERLRQNLANNRARNEALFAEAIGVSLCLTHEGVLFAHLKGITLTPNSVPDASLRLQLDLDLMVSAMDAGRAAHVLEAMGYVRMFVSGDTWEFKAGAGTLPSFQDMYKTKTQRVVELHLAPAEGLLERVELRQFGDAVMPTLSPEDIYLQQALHLFKHLRSSFTRAAWLLEARHHMLTLRDDAGFWGRLEALVSGDIQARIALGVVTQLVLEVFGDQPPAFLSGLIESDVSAPVRLWIERYGRCALLADFPGTKLYLLLTAQVDSSEIKRRAALLPLAPPPMITLGQQGEGLRSKLRRGWIQVCFILFRVRFHSVEGLRYWLESSRFRRLVAGMLP